MGDDVGVQEQLTTAQTELGTLRAERDQLRKDLERQTVEIELRRELNTRLNPMAADDVARLLASQSRRGASGELVHDGLEAIGVDGVVDAYLRGRGSFLLKTAAIDKGKDDDRAAPQWDLKRALKDIPYNEEWKAADPVGHKAAWADHLEAIQERQRRAAIR